MDLAGRIRTEREARQMSQEALARQAGMSLRALNSLERGEAVNPHYATLAGIADAFGMSISELLEEPVPLGEAPLFDDPRVIQWLRERGLAWGTTTDAGVEKHVRGLDLEEVDEDGRPVAVMELGRAVTDEQDKARELLWTPSKYRSLGSRLSVDPDAPVAEQKLQRHDRLRELRRDLDRRYRRRAYALMRYAELLAAQKEGAAENSGFEPEPAATTQEGLWNQAVEEYAA